MPDNRLKHLKNLIALSLADGRMDSTELHWLQEKAMLNGLTPDELSALVQQPELAALQLPIEQEEKENFLSELIYTMLLDGEIHEKEYQICLQMAHELELEAKDLDRIVGTTRELWRLQNAL